MAEEFDRAKFTLPAGVPIMIAVALVTESKSWTIAAMVTGNLALNIEGSGASVLAVTSTLNGTASLTAHSGALVGLNVEQLLRRLERRPLSGNGDFRSGRTPFDQLVLNLAIDHGVVAVQDMHIDGPAVRLAVGGQASVPMRDLDLKGTATLISSATTTEFELPFVVQGRWDDPIMLPDLQCGP